MVANTAFPHGFLDNSFISYREKLKEFIERKRALDVANLARVGGKLPRGVTVVASLRTESQTKELDQLSRELNELARDLDLTRDVANKLLGEVVGQLQEAEHARRRLLKQELTRIDSGRN